MSSEAREAFSLKSLIPGAYLPSMIAEIGVGAMIPVIATSATHLGASLAIAGLMAAMLPIGQILADVPAGALAGRIGDRRAMVVATGVALVGMLCAALAPNLWLLGIGVVTVGAANATFGLARQSYLAEVTPTHLRARALSTLGGVARIGQFLGPFIGALVIHGGTGSNAFWVGVATSIIAGTIVLAVPDLAGAEHLRAREAASRRSIRAVIREHVPVLTTLGFAVLLVGSVRGARQTVLPLWTEHLGLSPATTSLIYGLCGAVDMLLFYPAGKIMDVAGRLWVAIPSMAIMGLSMLLLPLTHSVLTVGLVAVLLGVGNGLGSGILMTLGADVAPPGERSQFLGVWRLEIDIGNASGPLIISAGASLGSLAGGVIAIGVLSAGTCLALGRWVGRWSVHANRRTRVAAGVVEDRPG